MICTQCGQDVLIWFEDHHGALCITCKKELDKQFEFVKTFNEQIRSKKNGIRGVSRNSR